MVSNGAVAFVSQKLERQGFAGIFFARLAGGWARQQNFRFDLQELGRDDQEGRYFIGISILHQAQVLQVLVCYLRQCQFGDIQLSVFDQLQE